MPKRTGFISGIALPVLSDFLAVEGYPMAKRPFYTHPEPGRPGHSNSFDLLFRGLELVRLRPSPTFAEAGLLLLTDRELFGATRIRRLAPSKRVVT